MNVLKALNALRLRRKAAREALAAQTTPPAPDHRAYLTLEPGSYQVHRSGADHRDRPKPKR